MVEFDKNMSVVSVAGINDFNYHEMVALEKSVDVTHHAFIRNGQYTSMAG